jgi:hypothetical protein
VAVFASTVHPDEKDIRVAISKQNILLSALLWTSTGLFLIEAGVTIASLASKCVNRVLRCALDLAVVARRVKSIGRRPVATITFLVVMAPPGFVSAILGKQVWHNASPVCMGLGAGSCVEKSFYPGITVKF